ncbi:MAG: CPBP family glutamic-type intramembrane protease, partial [Candidatus Heimdallarchaeaceae archaeon]
NYETENGEIRGISTLSHILAIVIICGLIGLYSLFAKLAIILIKLMGFAELNEGLMSFIISTLMGLIMLIVFFVINRKNLNQYYIEKQFDKIDLVVVCIGIALIVLLSYFLALVKLGTVSWLPFNEWGETIAAAIFIGIKEELEFRSVMLVHTTFWLNRLIKDEKKAKIVSGSIVILFFGLFWHIRYIFSQEFFVLGIVIVFAVFSTIFVLKKKTIVPMIILHIALDFFGFLFIGGTIKQL